MKIKKLLTTVLALVITALSCQIHTMDVQAGSSDIVIDSSAFAEKLDETKWYAPNADVVVENGKVIFSKDSTEETRLISRQGATVTEYYEEMFRADYTLKLNQVAAGKEFIVAFSLRTAESNYGENGNFEIAFVNENGIKVSVRAIDDDGAEQVLVSKVGCGVKMGSAFQVNVVVTKDMKTKVTVNGKAIYNAVSPISMEGRMGFLQTGGCAAEIQKLDIISHAYDRPENTDFVEDFESGSMNKNVLTSQTVRDLGYFPAGVLVEEYQGNHVLMFRNVWQCYFGTKHQYSNFEMSFDIPYVLYKNIVDEEGNITSPAHGNFVIGLGDAADYTHFGYQYSAEALVFNPTSISSFTKSDTAVDFSDKGYFDVEKNEGYSVKISVIDTQIKVYVKALKATQYDEVLNYKVGQATPLGHIHFWTTGATNFAIDNLKITNKDKSPNTIELAYEAAKIEKPEDWKYEPIKAVDEEVKDEPAVVADGFNPIWIPIFAGGVGVLFIVISVIVIVAKRKKSKKEVGSYES